MTGIPSELYNRLRSTLLRCGTFDNENEMRSAFVDSRIYPWRDMIPSAPSPSGRAANTISFLCDQYNEEGKNALILLLRVLSEQRSTEDICHHELHQLADRLESTVEELSSLSPENLDDEIEYYLNCILNERRFRRWSSKDLGDHYASLMITDFQEQFPILILDYGPKGVLGSRPMDAIPSILDSQKLVVLGDPGAGKTTIFEKAMYEVAAKTLASARRNATILPVFVSLRYYNGEEDLVELINMGIRRLGATMWSDDQIHRLLGIRNVTFLVLFDGLNEVPVQHRHRITILIQRLWDKFPFNQYVVNCRTNNYHFEFGGTPTVITQHLSDAQIIQHLSFHLGFTQGRAAFSNLPDSLKFICRTPIILSMLTSAIKVGLWPQNRGQLYSEFIRSILWREGSKGDLSSRTELSAKQSVLRHIAYSMQSQGVLYFSDEDCDSLLPGGLFPGQPKLNIHDIIEELKLNGLLSHSQRGTSFVHQSFQEFFAAERLEGSLPSDLHKVSELAIDIWWHETLLMLAGFSRHPNLVVTAILKTNPLLAAQCLMLGRTYNSKVVNEVVQSIGQMIKSNDWVNCRIATDVFADIGLSESIPYLIPLLIHYERTVRWGAIHALRQIREPDTINDLLKTLTDSDWVNRGEACVAIAEVAGKAAIKHLVPVLEDEHAYARGRAAYAIYLALRQENFTSLEVTLFDNPKAKATYEWISLLAQVSDFSETLLKGLHSDNTRITEAAINILVEEPERTDIEQAVASLDSLVSHQDSFLRAAAVQALGKLQVYEKIPTIVKCMQSDPVSFVREIAVFTLGYLNAKEAFSAMTFRLRSDPSAEVRRRILLNLIEIRIPSAVTDVVAVLKDPDFEVRSIACRYLAEYGDYKHKKEIEPLINDEQQIVREAALSALRSISRRSRLGAGGTDDEF